MAVLTETLIGVSFLGLSKVVVGYNKSTNFKKHIIDENLPKRLPFAQQILYKNAKYSNFMMIMIVIVGLLR